MELMNTAMAASIEIQYPIVKSIAIDTVQIIYGVMAYESTGISKKCVG